jgi:hypothetical protein
MPDKWSFITTNLADITKLRYLTSKERCLLCTVDKETNQYVCNSETHVRKCAFASQWSLNCKDNMYMATMHFAGTVSSDIGALGESLGAACLAEGAAEGVATRCFADVDAILPYAAHQDLRDASWIAARFGKLDILKEIWAAETGDWPEKENAWRAASAYGHGHVIRYILSRTPSTDDFTELWEDCLGIAVGGGHADVVRVIMDDSRMMSHMERGGEDPDRNYFQTASRGYRIVNHLWEDFFERSTSNSDQDVPPNELCAIMRRKHASYSEVVHMLLGYSFAPCILSDGTILGASSRTPLHLAVCAGNASVVSTLLEHGPLLHHFTDMDGSPFNGYIMNLLKSFDKLSFGRYENTRKCMTRDWYAEVLRILLHSPPGTEDMFDPSSQDNAALNRCIGMAKNRCGILWIQILAGDNRVRQLSSFAPTMRRAVRYVESFGTDEEVQLLVDAALRKFPASHAEARCSGLLSSP